MLVVFSFQSAEEPDPVAIVINRDWRGEGEARQQRRCDRPVDTGSPIRSTM